MSLKRILSKIEEELKERKNVKDELYDAMRKATRFSKQAIFLVHKGKFKEAKKILRKTKKLFDKRGEVPVTHKELVYAGIVDAAFQEYTEAHVFLKLLQDDKFVSPQKIGVPSSSYLLGLGDVIGELRRRALDSLREGDVKSAEKSLDTMELIYNELTGMEEAMHSVSELRRKTDIARRIIESTRGDVTIEVRRSSLERSIERLEKTLKSKK
jgi:translin